jgi:hypothetical protein
LEKTGIRKIGTKTHKQGSFSGTNTYHSTLGPRKEQQSLIAGYFLSVLFRKNNQFRVIGEIDQTVNLLASTTIQITNTNIPGIILPGDVKQL